MSETAETLQGIPQISQIEVLASGFWYLVSGAKLETQDDFNK